MCLRFVGILSNPESGIETFYIVMSLELIYACLAPLAPLLECVGRYYFADDNKLSAKASYC